MKVKKREKLVDVKSRELAEHFMADDQVPIEHRERLTRHRQQVGRLLCTTLNAPSFWARCWRGRNEHSN